MPIVHKPEEPQPKKECQERPPYYHDGSYEYNSFLSRYKSLEPKGTIWECPGCGQFAVTLFRNDTKVWIPVRWYHFKSKRIIRKLEQPGVDSGSTVL